MTYIPKDRVLDLWKYWRHIEAYDIVKDMKGIEIVHCRDCKYAEKTDSPITAIWCSRFGIKDMAVEENDFCSYGERSE